MMANRTLLLVVLFLVSCNSYGKKTAAASPAGGGFAVVELFTSEGCSSCPAAEAALREIHDEYGPHVYVLEFHVDYWNYIGWKDVFSSPAYTTRQQAYARAFHLSSTYTPQAIVNGAGEMVGSDKAKLREAITAGLGKKAANDLKVSASVNAGTITVSYNAAGLRGMALNVALVQKKAETSVKKGENEGRKLQHTNVVRELKTVDNMQPEGTVTFALPQGLAAADCSIIAYAQDKSDLLVTGAGECEVK